MSHILKRCIYCNLNHSINDSDIIPKAITNKKIVYHSVCSRHNELIGNLYEDDISKKVAQLRRSFDIPSRKQKKDLTYRVILKHENDVVEFPYFSGVAEAFWNGIEGTALDGKKKALKIASPDDQDGLKLEKFTIEYCEFKDMVNTLTHINMFKLVAKIGYEYYCKSNNITGYDENQFKRIVGFILNSSNIKNDFVDVITDWSFYNDLNNNIDFGSHALFTMKLIDGHEYVIFSLWGIIVYKIFIRKWSVVFPHTIFNNYYACRSDGSLPKFQLTTLGGSKDFESTKNISTQIQNQIYNNIELLLKYSLFTKDGKRRQINRIRNVLYSNRDQKDKIFYLVGSQDQEVICFCYTVLLVYNNRSLYNPMNNFNQNIKSMLGTNEYLYIDKKDYFNLKDSMDDNTFIETLIKAIDFFESI